MKVSEAVETRPIAKTMTKKKCMLIGEEMTSGVMEESGHVEGWVITTVHITHWQNHPAGRTRRKGITIEERRAMVVICTMRKTRRVIYQSMRDVLSEMAVVVTVVVEVRMDLTVETATIPISR